MLEGITATVKPDSVVSALIDNEDNQPVATNEEELLKRGYADLKANNPEILTDLAENDEDLLNKILDKHLKNIE